MRFSEISSLRWQHIDTINGEIKGLNLTSALIEGNAYDTTKDLDKNKYTPEQKKQIDDFDTDMEEIDEIFKELWQPATITPSSSTGSGSGSAGTP